MEKNGIEKALVLGWNGDGMKMEIEEKPFWNQKEF